MPSRWFTWSSRSRLWLSCDCRSWPDAEAPRPTASTVAVAPRRTRICFERVRIPSSKGDWPGSSGCGSARKLQSELPSCEHARDERAQTTPRDRPRRAGAAGGLAPAAAAAVAGRPALQRLGGAPRTAGSSSSTPGMATDDGLRQLELALAQVGLELADVRLVVCTHAHADHYGLAGPIVDAAGCELWIHPAWEHVRRAGRGPRRGARPPDRGGAPERRARPPRSSSTRRAAGRAPGIARLVPPDRELVPGVEVETDLGDLAGARDARPRALARRPAPARERAADLRRPPAGPDLAVLRLRPHARPGERVHRRARRGRPARAHGLCLAGHGRPFRDVPAKVAANRAELDAAPRAGPRRLRRRRPRTAFELIGDLVGPENLTPATGAWGLQLALAYIDHLVARGELDEVEGSDPRLWETGQINPTTRRQR